MSDPGNIFVPAPSSQFPASLVAASTTAATRVALMFVAGSMLVGSRTVFRHVPRGHGSVLARLRLSMPAYPAWDTSRLEETCAWHKAGSRLNTPLHWCCLEYRVHQSVGLGRNCSRP